MFGLPKYCLVFLRKEIRFCTSLNNRKSTHMQFADMNATFKNVWITYPRTIVRCFTMYLKSSSSLFTNINLQIGDFTPFKVVRPYDTPVRAITVGSLLCKVQFFNATLFRKIILLYSKE